MDVLEVRADLIAEQDGLDRAIRDLSDDVWQLPTASPRWTVADQIAHLTYFDHAAALAIHNPPTFSNLAAQLFEVAASGDEAVDELTLATYRAMTPAELLSAWRRERAGLAQAAATLTDDVRVSWFGPSMGSKSFLTARLMECWAHGQDVMDAVGMRRSVSDRIRHIVQLGFITRSWTYTNRGRPVPQAPLRMELIAPSGSLWTFGPDDATELVSGPAEDFCLIVVQRRHIDDTALVATPLAREWLLIAQAFAGPPTDGPSPASDEPRQAP